MTRSRTFQRGTAKTGSGQEAISVSAVLVMVSTDKATSLLIRRQFISCDLFTNSPMQHQNGAWILIAISLLRTSSVMHAPRSGGAAGHSSINQIVTMLCPSAPGSTIVPVAGVAALRCPSLPLAAPRCPSKNAPFHDLTRRKAFVWDSGSQGFHGSRGATYLIAAVGDDELGPVIR